MVAQPELDYYDPEHLDDTAYAPLSQSVRRAAERALHERDKEKDKVMRRGAALLDDR